MKNRIFLLTLIYTMISLNISNAQTEDTYVAPLPPDDPATPCNESALAGCDRNYDLGMGFNEYSAWVGMADCMGAGIEDLFGDPFLYLSLATGDPLAGMEVAYNTATNSTPGCLESVSENTFSGFLYVIEAWHYCEANQGNCPGRHD